MTEEHEKEPRNLAGDLIKMEAIRARARAQKRYDDYARDQRRKAKRAKDEH